MTKEYLERQFSNFADSLKNSYLHMKTYEVMPSDEELSAMKVGTRFKTLGYYNKLDGCGGTYIITSIWIGKRLLNNTNKFLVCMEDCVGLTYDNNNNAMANGKSFINVCKYGVRSSHLPLTDLNADADNTYAKINSQVMSQLVPYCQMKATFYFPVGKYYFKDPLNLTSKQISIKGDGIPPFCMSTVTTSASYNNSTVLLFPFLTKMKTQVVDGVEQAVTDSEGNIQYDASDVVALATMNASVEDVLIIGNPNVYNITFDRDKFYQDPSKIVKETIMTYPNGDDVKIMGLYAVGCNVQNVAVAHFYYGMYTGIGNGYINNVFAYGCHYGAYTANDNKFIGLYGWNVYTLGVVTGSLVSLNQVRADSCVNLLHVNNGSGIVITDADGDFCTESLIKIGSDKLSKDSVGLIRTIKENNKDRKIFDFTSGTIWGTVQSCIFNGIHGRCCTKNAVYSLNSAFEPNVVDINSMGTNTSGYGVIEVCPQTNFKNNRIVMANMGGGNPADKTMYKTASGEITKSDKTDGVANTQILFDTPRVVLTFGNKSSRDITGNCFECNYDGKADVNETNIAQRFQNNMNSAGAFSARVNLFNGSYLLNGTTVTKLC